MKKRGFSAEQIIGKLREAEVVLSHGSTVGEVSRKLGITKQAYYRWRREYGRDAGRSGPKAQGARKGEWRAHETGGRFIGNWKRHIFWCEELGL
jgi:transposase-like protein